MQFSLSVIVSLFLVLTLRAEEINLTTSSTELSNNSKINFYYQQKHWRGLEDNLVKFLKYQHKKYLKIFPELKNLETDIILLDKETFFLKSKAPKWVSAFYHNKKIFISIDDNSYINLKKIKKSLGHEYIHAIVDQLSNNQAPFWLDEGLAKWFEGELESNEILLLKDYLRSKRPLKLDYLNKSFTKLNKDQSKIAYVQTVVLVDYMIDTYGFDSITKLLKTLRVKDLKKAIIKVFKIPQPAFELRFQQYLKDWRRKHSNYR